MKDLTITYKNGKYESLIIDGHLINGIESFSLTGTAHEPTRLTMTMAVTGKEMISSESVDPFSYFIDKSELKCSKHGKEAIEELRRRTSGFSIPQSKDQTHQY